MLDEQHAEHIGRVESDIFYLVFPCEGVYYLRILFWGYHITTNVADPHRAAIQTQLWANHQELLGTPRWFLFTDLSIYTPAKNYLPRPLILR